MASADDLDPEYYPTLRTISGAFMYRFMLRPLHVEPAEYVCVPIPERRSESDDLPIRTSNFIAKWSYAWEAGQLRHEIRSEDRPENLSWLDKYEGRNLALIADEGQRSSYDFYQGLYHLLPRATLERYGLPLFKTGHWPCSVHDVWADRMLPADANDRLASAFAAHVWPMLSSGSSIDKFSSGDPIRLLAHNLDFWVPHLDAVLARRASTIPRIPADTAEQTQILEEARASAPEDVEINRPLGGGPLWLGEGEALEVAHELVDVADDRGGLRAIIEAIRSHRVEDDFSSRWSYAREDFERKLWRKRSKTKVSFVELSDTTPVHGRCSEVHENLLWEDFIALCDVKERRIVVCLRNGVTRVGEIARELGYANHSPVSKALARIRRRAARLLFD